MTVWSKVCNYPQTISRYRDHQFLIEVRDKLAIWLENRFLYQYHEPLNHEACHEATFYDDLLNEFKEVQTKIKNTQIKEKLEKVAVEVQTEFNHSREKLFEFFSQELKKDYQLYKNERRQFDNRGLIEFKDQFEELQRKCENIDQLTNQINDGLVDGVEIVSIVNMCEAVQREILDTFLSRWKNDERRKRYDYKPLHEIALETIGNWCEILIMIEFKIKQNLLQCIFSCRLILNSLTRNQVSFIQMQAKRIEELMKALTVSSLVVVEQPDVITTGNNIKAKCCFLTGNFYRARNINLTVNCYITSKDSQFFEKIFQETLSQLLINRNEAEELHLILPTNNSTMLTLDTKTHQYYATFGRLSIESSAFNRSGSDEKYYLLFEMNVSTMKHIYTLISNSNWTIPADSFPFIKTTNPCQRSKSLAPLFWESIFILDQSAHFFEIPETVPWSVFARALTEKFATNCGDGLSGDDVGYLRNRLFRNEPSDDPDLTYELCCVDNLPGRSFTFFEWFYETMQFCKTNLYKEWNCGKQIIYGFCTKEEAETLLSGRPQGTFLLRFSESQLGAIAVSYVKEDGSIDKLGPISKNETERRCFADCILDLPQLFNVYPDIPKDVFKEFLPAEDESSTRDEWGYKKPTLKISVEK